MANAATMMHSDADKKSGVVGYLLWFFLGGLGVYRFYLGAAGSGAAQLIRFIVSFVLTFVAVGLIGFTVLTAWWIVDAFLIPYLARGYNDHLAPQLMGGGCQPMA